MDMIFEESKMDKLFEKASVMGVKVKYPILYDVDSDIESVPGYVDVPSGRKRAVSMELPIWTKPTSDFDALDMDKATEAYLGELATGVSLRSGDGLINEELLIHHLAFGSKASPEMVIAAIEYHLEDAVAKAAKNEDQRLTGSSKKLKEFLKANNPSWTDKEIEERVKAVYGEEWRRAAKEIEGDLAILGNRLLGEVVKYPVECWGGREAAIKGKAYRVPTMSVAAGSKRSKGGVSGGKNKRARGNV